MIIRGWAARALSPILRCHDLMVSRLTGRGLLVAYTLALLGCSSVTATRRPTSPAEASRIVSTTGGREVRVEFESPRGPEIRRGVLVPFDANTFVVVEASGQRLGVPFQATRTITYNDRGKGAGIGFLVGAIPGFLLGFAAGATLADCHAFGANEDKPCSSNTVTTGLEVGLAGGLLGGALGAALGAVAGHSTTLTF